MVVMFLAISHGTEKQVTRFGKILIEGHRFYEPCSRFLAAQIPKTHITSCSVIEPIIASVIVIPLHLFNPTILNILSFFSLSSPSCRLWSPLGCSTNPGSLPDIGRDPGFSICRITVDPEPDPTLRGT